MINQTCKDRGRQAQHTRSGRIRDNRAAGKRTSLTHETTFQMTIPNGNSKRKGQTENLNREAKREFQTEGAYGVSHHLVALSATKDRPCMLHCPLLLISQACLAHVFCAPAFHAQVRVACCVGWGCSSFLCSSLVIHGCARYPTMLCRE